MNDNDKIYTKHQSHLSNSIHFQWNHHHIHIDMIPQYLYKMHLMHKDSPSTHWYLFVKIQDMMQESIIRSLMGIIVCSPLS